MIKISFELYPEDGRIKPYEHPFGYVFRGLIMEWLHNIEPKLVHEYHSYGKVRPYSIHSIIYDKVPKIEFNLITFDNNLKESLLKDIIKQENPKFKLGQKNYYIGKIYFETINLRKIFDDSKPITSFKIKFITPTYFSTSLGDYPVRFPLPSLLFGNLAKIWNTISERTGDIDTDRFINWINAHVYASFYKLIVKKRLIGKPQPVYGCAGYCNYKVQKINKLFYKKLLEEENREYDYEYVNEDYLNNCRWLEILCKIGEYTNVGTNRTAGLGVIRYYPYKYVNKEILIGTE